MSSPPPKLLRETQQLHPRRRHAAELHPGQHQGLVQKHLRSRQPAPHQHRQQPPPLRRHPAHQRRARGADRAENPRHQPAPGHGADRRLQERPRQRLHQDAALLHAALHRQQPQRHLVFRQQQHPPLQLQCRRALSARLSVRRRGQQEDHPPRQLRRDASSPNARWAR